MAEQSSTTDQLVSPEQLLYAKFLEKGMIVGLVLLIVTFVIYAAGIIKPYIPKNEVALYWSHTVDDYLHMADVKAGWAWLGMLGYGDFLNFIPIAILAGTTMFCFLSIVPTLWRKNDKVYAVFAMLEVIILAVAASGILGAGGH
ncbi:MAG: hypothetical protein PVG78_12655 [Desulfobacterales bacterium]|jgi:hypothetical protein